MKAVISFGVVLLLVLLALEGSTEEPARAEDSPDQSDALASFSAAASRHKRELADLYAVRNVEPPEVRNISSPDAVATTLASAAYPDRTSVLFYSFEANSLRLWLIDQHGLRRYHRSVLAHSQILTTMDDLRTAFRVEALQLARTPQPRGASRLREATPPTGDVLAQATKRLTDLLLPESIRQDLAQVRHLIVVPARGLGTVPFAALQPFDTRGYLVDRLSISIAPSLSDLSQNVPQWESVKGKRSLVVGNPYLALNDKWDFPSLQGAEDEAESVAGIVGTKPLLGKEATKERVTREATTARILYLACHGIADQRSPLSGGCLMLSGKDWEHSAWTASEVQEMRFEHADLVVLSACQTGLGLAHDAGMIGLARAFQIAGAPRVVMSLWSVDDKATCELMRAFMQRCVERTAPAESLRLAMIEMKQRYPEPSRWAGFALFGTPR